MTNQIRTNGTKEYPSDVMNKEAKPAIAEAAIQEILPCPPLTAGLRDNIATLHAMHLPDEDISALISGKPSPSSTPSSTLRTAHPIMSATLPSAWNQARRRRQPYFSTTLR